MSVRERHSERTHTRRPESPYGKEGVNTPIPEVRVTVLRPPRNSIERMLAHHCCSGHKLLRRAGSGSGETTVTPIPRFHSLRGRC
jgi:hypothetical protein